MVDRRASPYTAGIGYAEIEAIARSAARSGHPQDAEVLGLMRRAMALDPAE